MIPAPILAEAREAYDEHDDMIGNFDAALAVLSRHWPAPETRTIFQYPPGTERAGFSSNGVNLEGRKIDVEQLERWHHDATVRLPHFEKDYSELTVFRAEVERLRAARRDRYAAGFRDGVEKAAAEVERLWGVSLTGYQTAAALRALAPPDDHLIVGRLTWEERAAGSVVVCRLGKRMHVGTYSSDSDGRWFVFPIGANYSGPYKTPEAARAALVEAVRREVEGGGDE